jgi:DNA-binding NarL/FixJ family response regulator
MRHVRRGVPKIFISYRRNDSGAYAGRVYDHLQAAFGKTQVFIDTTTLQPGEEFSKSLPVMAASCDTLIALIGKRWLSAKDRGGRRRLDDPSDLVRREISAALRRGALVVPVLVAGARMPIAGVLPHSLKALAGRHALRLSDEDFEVNMASLVQRIKQVIDSDAEVTSKMRTSNARTEHDGEAQTQLSKGHLLRILLADDHTIVRQGLKLIFSSRPDLEVVGEAANGREAVELAEKLKPDVVVMDVAMPELNGIEATRRMVQTNPLVRVLVLSMHREAVYIREILRAGARGYILKDAIDTELLTAVTSVARGDGYMSPAVAGALLGDYRPNVTDPMDLLTGREREVLRLIAEGKSNREIATCLEITLPAVDSHRGQVMEKLNLHSTGELVRFAMKRGLID